MLQNRPPKQNDEASLLTFISILTNQYSLLNVNISVIGLHKKNFSIFLIAC